MVSHSLILTRLAEWNVPSWLLRIVASYLSGRTMIVRHRGAQSTPHPLPGGLAQGDEVGMILFLVAVAGAGVPLSLPQPPPPTPTPSPSLPPPPPAVTESELRLKFVDDLTLSEVVKLKQQLQPSPPFIGPLNFHERNGYHLPKNQSKLQSRLTELEQFVNENHMKINSSKSKVQPFNFSRKYDFLPSLSFENEELEVVYSTKLLGVHIESSCKWEENTRNLVHKSNPKLWFLRRLKNLGTSPQMLLYS